MWLVNYIGYYLGSANKSSGILMEYIRLDLRRALMVDERFKELSVKLLIAKQVASGMNFLHSLTPYILVNKYLKLVLFFFSFS